MQVVDKKEIVNIHNIEGELRVSSREIAENFNKNHKEVLRSIENHIKTLGGAQKCASLFMESKYQHKQNKQWYKEYLLTRDGFSFAVMSFNGQESAEWKLKYIEAFNKMEQELRNPYLNLSKELQAILTIDKKQQLMQEDIIEVKEDLQDFKEDIPLFAIECDEISKLVRKVGTNVLSGKLSNAYKDKSIRSKVYSDIYRQLRREFGVTSYKAIKRRQLDQALESVENYKLPIFLAEEINLINKYESRGDLVC